VTSEQKIGAPLWLPEKKPGALQKSHKFHERHAGATGRHETALMTAMDLRIMNFEKLWN
jgi:hypothetical protein